MVSNSFSCKKKFFFLMLFFLILAGCNSQLPNQPPSGPLGQETSTSPSSIGSSFTSTRVETLQLAAPTITMSPTAIPSSTALPVVPTLADVERAGIIQQLINSNAQCKLPCFWGITPGINRWADAIPLFTKLRAKIETGSNAHINYVLTFDASAKGAVVEHVYNDFDFMEKDDLVDTITVYGKGSERPEELQPIWQSYSPEQIIMESGEPTRVLISSSPSSYGNTGKQGYYLWLFYDKNNFMIRYEGEFNFSSTYHICPKIGKNGEITDIYIKTQAPTNPLPLENGDEILSSIGSYEKVLTFEQATGKTLDDFYAIFNQKGKPACFDTAQAIWKP
jgi:hypothetical protein